MSLNQPEKNYMKWMYEEWASLQEQLKSYDENPSLRNTLGYIGLLRRREDLKKAFPELK
jgi:hypothetical protein